MPEYPAGDTTILAPGEPEALKNFKIASMAEAMQLAKFSAREVEDDDPDPYGYAQELEQELGIDILGAQWKATPDDDRWVKRIKARGRRAAVANLYVKGHKVADIAKRVRVSEVTVYKDISMIMQDWRKSYLDDIELLASKDLATLDYMLEKLGPRIDNGDPKAIGVALSIIQERGSILGIRAGVQVDITQYIREVAESAGYDPEKAIKLATKIGLTMK